MIHYESRQKPEVVLGGNSGQAAALVQFPNNMNQGMAAQPQVSVSSPKSKLPSSGWDAVFLPNNIKKWVQGLRKNMEKPEFLDSKLVDLVWSKCETPGMRRE